MLIKDIVREVNGLLADEVISYQQMKRHLDKTIDKINSALSSLYPAFSELPAEATTYAYFPDRFIRMVVIPGAAYHFYLTDEEGSPTAMAYGQMFQEGMFIMTRDWLDQVPQIYENPSSPGAVYFNLTGADDGGLFITEMRP